MLSKCVLFGINDRNSKEKSISCTVLFIDLLLSIYGKAFNMDPLNWFYDFMSDVSIMPFLLAITVFTTISVFYIRIVVNIMRK